MESSKTVTKAPPRYHIVVHFEIPANDPSKIARFYEQLFGWKFTKMEGGNMDYWLISHKDAKSPYETLGDSTRLSKACPSKESSTTSASNP